MLFLYIKSYNILKPNTMYYLDLNGACKDFRKI